MSLARGRSKRARVCVTSSEICRFLTENEVQSMLESGEEDVIARRMLNILFVMFASFNFSDEVMSLSMVDELASTKNACLIASIVD